MCCAVLRYCRYAWNGVRQLGFEVAEVASSVVQGTNATSLWHVQGSGVLMTAWQVSTPGAPHGSYFVVAVANTANQPTAIRLWCSAVRGVDGGGPFLKRAHTKSGWAIFLGSLARPRVPRPHMGVRRSRRRAGDIESTATHGALTGSS